MKLITVMMIFFVMVLYSQQSVTITASKDNTLYEDADGTFSNGAGAYLFAGKVGASGDNKKRRALLQFSLEGQIPTNATVTGVTLKMNMSRSGAGVVNVTLHKLSASWGEGNSNADANEGAGDSSSANDATWKHRFFNAQQWTSFGGDFIASASASKSVSGVGFYEWNGSTMIADVTDWLTNPASNFGWIVIGDETAQSSKRFDSREHTTVANRPTLTIQYSVQTIVPQETSLPNTFTLSQNFPNPFNPTTTVSFSVEKSGYVTLNVFDVLGNKIATIVDRSLAAGNHTAEIDAEQFASGVYFYRLQSGSSVATKKMIVQK